MATSSFSKRTLAIAVAAGMAISGVQAVAPAGAADAPVASADATDHVRVTDVTFVGLFDETGKLEGNVRSDAKVTEPFGYRVVGAEPNLRFDLDIKNTSVGDKVKITPVGEDHQAIQFRTSQTKQTLSIQGTDVAVLDVVAGGSATVTFIDGVEEIASGQIELTLPVSIWSQYGADVGRGKKAVAEGRETNWNVRIETSAADGTSKEEATVGQRKVAYSYSDQATFYTRTDVYVGDSGVEISQSEAGVKRIVQRLPNYTDLEVVLRPTTASDIKDAPEGSKDQEKQRVEEQRAKLAEWSFTRAVDPKLQLWEFNEEGKHIDTLSGAKIPQGIQFDSEYLENGELKVTIRNVPTYPDGTKRYKPIIDLSGSDPYVGTGVYEAGKELWLTAAVTQLDGNGQPVAEQKNDSDQVVEQPWVINNLVRRMPPSNDSKQDGTVAVRSAEVTGLIVGQADGVGLTQPARIAGKEATFRFAVKNTGGVPIRSVTVTPVAGEASTQAVLIQPGEVKHVDFKYAVPAAAATVPFTVSYPGIAPDRVTFQVDQSSQYVQNPDGSVTITGPQGNPITAVSWEEYLKLQQRVKELEGRTDVHVIDARRNADNSITLILNDPDKTEITIPAASKKGLERCMSGTGGVILALLPVLGLLGAGLSQVKLPGIGEQMERIQRQAGIYNEDLARFVADNGPAIGTTIGALAAALLLFVPGTCGDMSLAGAIGEAGSGSSAKPAADATPAQ